METRANRITIVHHYFLRERGAAVRPQRYKAFVAAVAPDIPQIRAFVGGI